MLSVYLNSEPKRTLSVVCNLTHTHTNTHTHTHNTHTNTHTHTHTHSIAHRRCVRVPRTPIYSWRAFSKPLSRFNHAGISVREHRQRRG
jgi:hypothetical protein